MTAVLREKDPDEAQRGFAEDLLRKAEHNVLRVVAVRSAGDVGDGGGEEVLWITDAPRPVPMTARIIDGKINHIEEGW